ncbi:MAG: hypothetical protein JWN78_1652 [Bacteroidota bacterium]|nr:hypothetical protein [Bacteroidota bacterium]
MNHFSNRAITGITKVGDIYCPKNGEFPAFSEAAGTQYLNNLVSNVPEDDFSSLNLVLIIFSFLPAFILKWLIGVFERSMDNPGDSILPSLLRQLNLGLRGLCYSVYYSEFSNPEYKGRTPLQIIDYHLNRVELEPVKSEATFV